MTQSQPPITRTTPTLPFDKLSPRDFTCGLPSTKIAGSSWTTTGSAVTTLAGGVGVGLASKSC